MVKIAQWKNRKQLSHKNGILVIVTAAEALRVASSLLSQINGNVVDWAEMTAEDGSYFNIKAEGGKTVLLQGYKPCYCGGFFKTDEQFFACKQCQERYTEMAELEEQANGQGR